MPHNIRSRCTLVAANSCSSTSSLSFDNNAFVFFSCGNTEGSSESQTGISVLLGISISINFSLELNKGETAQGGTRVLPRKRSLHVFLLAMTTELFMTFYQ